MTGHGRASDWIDGLPHRLWRANQGVHRMVVEAVEPLGVTVTQLGICVHLGEFGHMSASDLARLFRLTPQSVTTALGNLEKMDWVRRIPHPVHKRVIWYELTDAGEAGVSDGRTRVAEVDRRVRALLPDDVLDVLDAGLVTLIHETGGEAPSPGTMWPAPVTSTAR